MHIFTAIVKAHETWVIGNKLETKHAIYQKLAHSMYRKDTYVSRFESAVFDM